MNTARRTAFLRRSCGAILGLGLGLSLLTGCDVEFPEQEVYVRHNPATDSADVLLVYKGISAGDSLDKSLEALERLRQGRRELMVVDWPFYWDVDNMVSEAHQAIEKAGAMRDLPDQDATEWDAKRSQAELELEIAEQISLPSYDLFLDPDGRLSGYQWVHFGNVGWLLKTVNDLIRREVLAQEPAKEGEPGSDAGPSPRTRELWRQKAEHGTPWIAFRDRAFVFEIPASPEDAHRAIHGSLEEIAKEHDGGRKGLGLLAALLASLESYDYRDEVMRFVWRDAAQPGLALALRFSIEERTYKPELFEALKQRGVEPRADRTLEDVRNLLRTF